MNEVVGTCECCGYENLPVCAYTSLREYDIRNHLGPSTKRFCFICASTMLSTMISFPTQHAPGITDLARAIGWIANYMIAPRQYKDHEIQ